MAESLDTFSIDELILLRDLVGQNNQEMLFSKPVNFDNNLESILKQNQDENLMKSAKEFL